MRTKFDKFWLSFAAPALVFLGLFGFLTRKDNDRVQSFPAFVTGIGLISSSVIVRNMRRKNLLIKMLQIKKDVNS